MALHMFLNIFYVRYSTLDYTQSMNRTTIDIEINRLVFESYFIDLKVYYINCSNKTYQKCRYVRCSRDVCCGE